MFLILNPILKLAPRATRVAVAVCLLAGGMLLGWGWSSRVSEIRQADSLRNLPLAARHAAEDLQADSEGFPGLSEVIRTGTLPVSAPLPFRIDWRLPLPGPAVASPCLCGPCVVTPVFERDSKTLSLLACDRETGNRLWQTRLSVGPTGSIDVPRITAAPACDGQSIFLAAAGNGQLKLTAVDLSGRIRWTTVAGPCSPQQNLVSPVLLHGSLAIVACERAGRTGYLAGVHRLSGEVIWRVRTPGSLQATPVLAEVAGRTQLLVTGSFGLASYAPENGDRWWQCQLEGTPAPGQLSWNDELVFLSISHPHAATMAIRADGEGDVTTTHRAWLNGTAGNVRIPGVTCRHGLLTLTDNGVLSCLNAETGRLEWRQQLAGTFGVRPVLSGDQLLCFNQGGAAWALDLAQRGQIVQQGEFPERVLAGVVVSRSQWLLRTPEEVISMGWSVPEAPLVNLPHRPKQRL